MNRHHQYQTAEEQLVSALRRFIREASGQVDDLSSVGRKCSHCNSNALVTQPCRNCGAPDDTPEKDIESMKKALLNKRVSCMGS